jgi:hypothetical protein
MMRPGKALLTVLMAAALAAPIGAAVAHDQAFSDPEDSIHPESDLKRVILNHGGGEYTFKATIWNDFSNRSMRPGSGVTWELDTMDAVGEFTFDHHVVLNWMRHHGNKRYRCRILRLSNSRFVGNFPGRRDGRTVICPNIPDREWGDRRVFDWNVLSFHEGGFDSSGPHEHI